jgi:two-component system response regulator HydG
LPPLRERRDDIPLLAVHFAERAAREAHRPVPRISPDAMRVLMEYPWPGNVRELAHTIERAVLLCGGEEIARADLDLGVPLGTVPAQPDLGEGWVAYRRRLIRAGAREFFAQLLAQTRGNVREAARRAGISARAVYDLLAEAELDPDAFRATGNGANGAPDSGPEPFLGSVPPAEGTSTPSSG